MPERPEEKAGFVTKRMRKILIRLVLAAAALALLLGACDMLWPYSFLDLQPGCDSVTVFYIDTADDNVSQCSHKGDLFCRFR